MNRDDRDDDDDDDLRPVLTCSPYNLVVSLVCRAEKVTNGQKRFSDLSSHDCGMNSGEVVGC